MPHQFNANDAPTEGRAEFPKFELAKDEVARVNLLSIKGWVVTVRHWVKGVGYVHCHASEKLEPNTELLTNMLKIQEEGGRPEDCLMCKLHIDGNDRIGAPKRQFAARILRYKTDPAGGLPRSGDVSFWLEIWLFDGRKYRVIQKIMAEWGGDDMVDISKHDIAITCTDQQYQNMTLQPLKNAVWATKQKEVLEYFKEEVLKYDLATCLGQTIDEESLQRRFAQIERRTQVDKPPDFPYEKPDADPTGAEATATATGPSPFDLADGAEKGEIPAVDKPEPQSEPASGGSLLDDLLEGGQ